MSVSDEFLEYILDQLSAWGDVTARKMFGGAGLYRDEKMFGLIADDVVYLKVDDSNREAFVQAGSGVGRSISGSGVVTGSGVSVTAWVGGR